jgi:hypothetical protein
MRREERESALRARAKAFWQRLTPALRAARRRPEMFLLAAVVTGVALMVVHWS